MGLGVGTRARVRVRVRSKWVACEGHEFVSGCYYLDPKEEHRTK
jgi:hypothetical protein